VGGVGRGRGGVRGDVVANFLLASMPEKKKVSERRREQGEMLLSTLSIRIGGEGGIGEGGKKRRVNPK